MQTHVPDTGMADWLKILITALSSFVVAMIAEPIKTAFGEYRERRKLRVALYTELADNLQYIYALCRDGLTVEDCLRFQGLLKTDVYVYAKQQPSLFYQLTDYPMLEQYSIVVGRMKASRDFADVQVIGQAATLTLSERFQTGQLDGLLLQSRARGASEEVITGALELAGIVKPLHFWQMLGKTTRPLQSSSE